MKSSTVTSYISPPLVGNLSKTVLRLFQSEVLRLLTLLCMEINKKDMNIKNKIKFLFETNKSKVPLKYYKC